MKRIILILTLLLPTAFTAFAQIEDEIANYQSNWELMVKARDYIKDKARLCFMVDIENKYKSTQYEQINLFLFPSASAVQAPHLSFL